LVGAVSNCADAVRLKTAPTGDRRIKKNKTKRRKLMKRVFVVVLAIVLFACVMINVQASNLEYNKGYSVSGSVEGSDLIVRGIVTGLDGVWRDLKYATDCTTDVTITVTDMIKGKTNAGENKVKFMVEGGLCLDPNGEWLNLDVSYEPEYKIGEEVLVFLAKCEDDFCNDFLYSKLVHWRGIYGKNLITEETKELAWLYLTSETDETAVKHVIIPLDLSIDMCKAAVRDADAVVTLEESIKTEVKNKDNFSVKISQTLMANLKRDVEAILEKKKETTDAKPGDKK